MLYLRGRQIKSKLISAVFICTAIVFSLTSQAQVHYSNNNFNKFQSKPYYYGLSLGLNTGFFRVEHSEDFILNEDYNVVESLKGPGFNIGVVGNLKIGQNFDIRSLISFSFVNRTIRYTDKKTGIPSSEKIESVFVEIPFLVRFKSAPYKDKRAFVIAGVKYSFDLANKTKNQVGEVALRISPSDFQAEVGAGLQIFLPYFILSPQIKYSQGLGNILFYSDDHSKNRVLDRILSRTLTFSLNFEG